MAGKYIFTKAKLTDKHPKSDPLFGLRAMERRLTRTSTAMQLCMNLDNPTYQKPTYMDHSTYQSPVCINQSHPSYQSSMRMTQDQSHPSYQSSMRMTQDQSHPSYQSSMRMTQHQNHAYYQSSMRLTQDRNLPRHERPIFMNQNHQTDHRPMFKNPDPSTYQNPLVEHQNGSAYLNENDPDAQCQDMPKFAFQNILKFDKSRAEKAAEMSGDSVVDPSLAEEEEMKKKRRLYVLKGVTSFYPPTSDKTSNQFARMSELRCSPKTCLFMVDMRGFKSENIQVFLKDWKVIIEGVRPAKGPEIHLRKTREIFPLPVGVRGDNLRIARGASGLLVFEEAWNFG